MYADGMAMLVTDYAVQVMGGHGYVRDDDPVELIGSGTGGVRDLHRHGHNIKWEGLYR